MHASLIIEGRHFHLPVFTTTGASTLLTQPIKFKHFTAKGSLHEQHNLHDSNMRTLLKSVSTIRY